MFKRNMSLNDKDRGDCIRIKVHIEVNYLLLLKIKIKWELKLLYSMTVNTLSFRFN